MSHTVIALGFGETTRTQDTLSWSVRREQNDEAATTFLIKVSDDNATEGLSVSRLSGKRIGARPSNELRSATVKRRFQGFFVQEEGNEARVALVDNGHLIDYRLPISLLREGGVYAENQPFELDELETKVDGIVFTGYKVKASAPASASRTVPLPLDAERKEKLARILARRGDA